MMFFVLFLEITFQKGQVRSNYTRFYNDFFFFFPFRLECPLKKKKKPMNGGDDNE